MSFVWRSTPWRTTMKSTTEGQSRNYWGCSYSHVKTLLFAYQKHNSLLGCYVFDTNQSARTKDGDWLNQSPSFVLALWFVIAGKQLSLVSEVLLEFLQLFKFKFKFWFKSKSIFVIAGEQLSLVSGEFLQSSSSSPPSTGFLASPSTCLAESLSLIEFVKYCAYCDFL